MLLVGLTGNIASGKSTVSQMLAERGATIIDADVLAREAVAVGSPAYRRIVDRWGREVVQADGALNRAALRQRVFRDPDQLEELNEIVHPEVARLREQLVEEARLRGAGIVVCDIPLLFEKKLVDEFDRIVLVDAPRPVRLDRLVQARGLREEDALQMIAAQMPAELKRARADCVIDNAGTLEQLEAKVDDVWRKLTAAADKPRLRPRRSSMVLRSVIDTAGRFDGPRAS